MTDFNPLALLMQGVYDVSVSGSKLQVADTNSTSVLAASLSSIYNAYIGALDYAANQTVQNAGNPTTYEQDSEIYSQLKTTCDTYTTQGQTGVSNQQAQASQDSSNVARLVQLISAATQIMQTSGQLISR